MLPQDIDNEIRDKPTFFQRPDRLHEPLYVLTTVFNAPRYRSRWKLHQDWVKMVVEAGAIPCVVEVAFRDRDFSVTEPDNPHHLQLRSSAEVWHKENALNLLIQRLPQDWQYLATIDSDISFARPDWANECLHRLQKNRIIQLWSEAEDLGPNFEGLSKHHSFVYSWKHDEVLPDEGYYGKPEQNKVFTYHPGFAWGYRRDALEDLGGYGCGPLIDWAILGAADQHMAKCLIGKGKSSLHPDIKGPYRDMVLQWEDRALRYIKKDLGYMDGKILHYWHGKKVNRFYWSRWQVITKTQFNPFTDLKRTTQGLSKLVIESERQEKLRDLLRAYFSSRNEDSIDVD